MEMQGSQIMCVVDGSHSCEEIFTPRGPAGEVEHIGTSREQELTHDPTENTTQESCVHKKLEAAKNVQLWSKKASIQLENWYFDCLRPILHSECVKEIRFQRNFRRFLAAKNTLSKSKISSIRHFNIQKITDKVMEEAKVDQNIIDEFLMNLNDIHEEYIKLSIKSPGIPNHVIQSTNRFFLFFLADLRKSAMIPGESISGFLERENKTQIVSNYFFQKFPPQPFFSNFYFDFKIKRSILQSQNLEKVKNFLNVLSKNNWEQIELNYLKLQFEELDSFFLPKSLLFIQRRFFKIASLLEDKKVHKKNNGVINDIVINLFQDILQEIESPSFYDFNAYHIESELVKAKLLYSLISYIKDYWGNYGPSNHWKNIKENLIGYKVIFLEETMGLSSMIVQLAYLLYKSSVEKIPENREKIEKEEQIRYLNYGIPQTICNQRNKIWDYFSFNEEIFVENIHCKKFSPLKNEEGGKIEGMRKSEYKSIQNAKKMLLYMESRYSRMKEKIKEKQNSRKFIECMDSIIFWNKRIMKFIEKPQDASIFELPDLKIEE